MNLIAVRKGVFAMNCEHVQELEVINKLAKGRVGKGGKVRVFLRINPDVEAHTHNHLKTGAHHNKFGVMSSALPEVFSVLKRCSRVDLCGIHFHIGSQL